LWLLTKNIEGIFMPGLPDSDSQHAFYSDENAVSDEARRQDASRHLMALNSFTGNGEIFAKLVAGIEGLADLRGITTSEQAAAAKKKYQDIVAEVDAKRGNRDSEDFPDRPVK
jgi:hypothetical protein